MLPYRIGQNLRRHALAYAASLGVCLLALAVFLHFRDDEPDGLPDLVFEHAGDPVIGAVASRHAARLNTAYGSIYRAASAAKLPKRHKLIEDCADGAPGAAEQARRFLLAAGPETFAEAQQARDALITMPEFRPLPQPHFEFPHATLPTSVEVACLHAEGKTEEARRLWAATIKTTRRAASSIRLHADWYVLGNGYGFTPAALDLPVILACRVATADEAALWLDCLGEPFDLQTPARRCIRNAVCLYDAGFAPLPSAKTGIAAWRTILPPLQPFDWKNPDSWLINADFRWMGANTLPNATMKLLRERFREDEHLVENPYKRYAARDEDLPALMFLEWNYGGKQAALSAQRIADDILWQYHLAETRQRLRFTAAAILRHAMRTGELPQTLAELKLPDPLGLDSYTHAPLKWDASTHRLWSVGSDGRDDGGKIREDLVIELGNPPWLAAQKK